MELTQLWAFLKVAEFGSVTRAAEALHQTQPAISRQIARLEQEVGRVLFERQARGVRLTDAGLLFKEKLEPLLLQLDEAKNALQPDPASARVCLAAIPTIAPYLLPHVLCEFRQAYPRATLEVWELTTSETLQQLSEGHIDLALLSLPLPEESVQVIELFKEQLLLALPENHRLAREPEISLDDVLHEPFVLLHEAHCLTGQLLGFCTRHRLAPLLTARLHQLATVLELIRLGQGISFVPEMAARPQAGIIYRQIGGEDLHRSIVVASHKTRFQGRLTLAMIELLKSFAARQLARNSL